MNIHVNKNSKRCISKYYKEKELIFFKYEALAYINEKYTVELKLNETELIWTMKNRRKGKYRMIAKSGG
ncbi:MAG: hypothetical protein MJ252_20385, partial [archaeon]|nr:hypothetical protein [archaeon]